ncbi:hypothetical protein AWZ03_003409 [Drosophila navojoa]|uniref:Protein TsetseEP domain-containing protein n=1 Tax=Drosophila navojoa TaxID=7232 RepID=A0A484BN50_DRONA|nr:uncharacterized protein LOC108655142 [Drosophila navojoa]TDG50193.1 hypothetical protein AWZ03_003409 [Drosophila navojoa]
MCAVQVENQLVGETSRRRLQLLGQQKQHVAALTAVLLMGICMRGACDTTPGLTAGIPIPWPDSTLDECHTEYMQAFANASSVYAIEYERCELTANETQIDLTIDVQLEREQIRLGHSALCSNFELCNQLDDDLEYLECHKDHGNENLDLMTSINYNATSAHTRLRQDFDAVQQTLMLCTLDAQVAYIGSMRLANEELQECRREVAAMDAN